MDVLLTIIELHLAIAFVFSIDTVILCSKFNKNSLT